MSGIEFMHSIEQVHWNLRPNNCLLDEGYNVKLTDFGLISQKNLSTSIANFLYSAPELIELFNPTKTTEANFSINGVKCDIFSAGIILYELVTGNLPFNDELCDYNNEQFERLQDRESTFW